MRNPEAPSHNPYDTRDTSSAEYRRDADLATYVVDAANELRNAAISDGATGAEVNNFFNQDETGRAGAFELAMLAQEVRNRSLNDPTAANLLPYEQKFIDHMALERQYETARASVDVNAMRTNTDPSISPEEAERKAIRALRAELQQQLDATTDTTEAAEIEGKMQILRDYLALEDEDRKGGEGSVERNFMRAGHAAEGVTGPQAQATKEVAAEMEGKLDAYDERTTLRIMAYEILRDKFPRTPNDVPADLPEAPELAYVDPNAPVADPTPDDPPAPAAPVESAQARELRERMEQQRLDSLRRQVAAHEAGGWSKRAKDFSDRRAGYDVKEYDELKAEYEAARDRKIERDLGTLLHDDSIDPDLKKFAVAEALANEWKLKREEENEVLQNTPVAKVAKWIGKHKLLVVGAGFILAPMTLGTSAGIGLAVASGAIAASKIDQKVRGMHEINAETATDQLYTYMRDGNDYGATKEYVDRISENERKKEKVKRTTLVTAGGVATALVGNHYFGSMDGFSHVLYGANHYVKGSFLAMLFGAWAAKQPAKK